MKNKIAFLFCIVTFAFLSSCKQESNQTAIASDVTADSLKEKTKPCPYCLFLDEMEEMNKNRGDAYKNLDSFLRWRKKYSPTIQKAYKKLLPREEGSINIGKLLREVDMCYDNKARLCPVAGTHMTSSDLCYNFEMQNSILLYAIATKYLSLLNDSIFKEEINAWMKYEESYLDLYRYKAYYPPIWGSGWLIDAEILGEMARIHKCRLQDIWALKNTWKEKMSTWIKPKDGLYLYNQNVDKLSSNLVDNIEEYDSIVKEEFGYPTVEYGLSKKKMNAKSTILQWVQIREELYKDNEKIQKWVNCCTAVMLSNLSKGPSSK